MTSSDSTITYDYNADGLRIKKTVDGVVHNYVYSGGKLVEETYGDTKLNFSVRKQNGKEISPCRF